MKIYSYVDKTRRNADMSFPVYIIVKNNDGRFFINTGITTCDRLIEGRVFPKTDKQAGRKTTILGKYLADVESICLREELAGTDNKELKSAIQKEVFGVVKKERKKTLIDYIEEFASTKSNRSTVSLYMLTCKKLNEYMTEKSVKDSFIDSIDADWLESFKQWCIDCEIKINSIGVFMRNIRATYNWCRKKKYTVNYPFEDYSIAEEETEPNDLSAEDLRKLRDYPCEDWQEKYVDFFFLSFYLAGMNPVDLLSLKEDSVKDGYVTFIRRKTNKQGATKIRTITLPLVDEALKIIKKYPSKDGFLLGFMDDRKDYHSFMKKCDEALKKIGTREIVPDKLGRMRKVEYHPIFPEITLYTARYSFGSIAANDLDISEQTIGQCLGHSWSKHVTARYISHDQRKVDNAVKRVVEFVARKNEP